MTRPGTRPGRLGRFRRFLGGLMPAGLGGAFFFLAMLAQEESDSPRLMHLLAGWLYGVAILGLLRLFRVTPGAYPVVGLLCGPVPLALFVARSLEKDQWGGLWFLGAILGCVIGVLEWARLRAVAGREDPEG